MKNLLLALAGTLMLSASTNAQTFSALDLYNYATGDAAIYYATSTNVNGDVINMQMSTNAGGWLYGNTYPSDINVTVDLASGDIVVAGIETFDCSTVYDVGGYDCFYQAYESSTTAMYIYGNDCSDIDALKFACNCSNDDTNNGYNQGYADGLADGEASCPEDLSAQLSACQASNAGLSDAVSAQGAQINDLQATIDSLEQANADLNGIIAAQDDMLADCSDANQTLMDAYADAQQTIAGLYEVNADLAIGLDECQEYTAWADWTISVLESNAVTAGELLDDCESVNDSLLNELADLTVALDNCQESLDDCSTDLDVVTGQAQNCATLYQEYQLFYVQVTNGLNAEINTLEDSLAVVNGTVDSLETELAVCQSDAEYFELLADDCGTTLADTIDFYNEVLIGAGTSINELTAEVDLLEGELDLALDLLEECGSDLVECDSVATAEVEYWMDNYYGAVAEGNALVDSLQTELTAAQECCSSCPAAIEDAVNNAQAQAAEDLLPVLEALADAQECCSSCPAAIETAVDNAIAQCEENNVGELMEVYYNGYAAGLEDCEGEVSGLVDIDGTVINVIGYYNQLGQVIDPRTATGVIIRKHDDGTFSKYIQKLQ